MAYYSDSQTEKILTELEKNIYSMYNVAYTEMKATAKDYLDKYKERYKKEYEAYKNGAYTDSEFKAWVQTQLARGDGYEKMADKMAKRMVEADKVASAYINDATPSIYSLNYNYEAYKISQTKGVDFQLADEQTVKELANDNNHIEFKTTSINPKRDYEWNSKKIQSALNSGILQGKSIDKLADGFYSVMKSDRASAIRNARTSFTSAQNAGRMASYEKATEMGINLEKEWIATKDARTRDTHGALDGVRIPYSEAFSNGLMYPADPEGEPCEVYNCRCTMRAVLPNINDKHRETYSEWLESMKPEEAKEEERVKSEILNKLEKSNIEYKKVEEYSIIPSKEEIIYKLQGGDMTAGSCASLCMAYIGNIAGYDVTDYRGGESQKFFSRTGHIIDIFNLSGKAVVVEDFNEIKVGVQLLKTMEEGKEYCLSIGSHASMVRLFNGSYQYLELQSSSNSGWTDFNGNPRYTLKNRFGCSQSRTSYGMKLKTKSTLIDSDAMKGVTDFKDILGYLNTNKESQKKGGFGSVK